MIAATAALADDATAPEASSDPNKVVCKTLEPPTGSRLGARRQCLTQQQWDQMRKQAQENVNRLEMKGHEANVGGGGH
jgi:hypothetical protein